MIKRTISLLYLLGFILLVVPIDLWGAIYYFSDKSLATLDATLRDLKPGDTLIFLPGSYDASEAVTISPSYPHNHSNGLPGSPITLKAMEKGTVIFDGGNDWTNGGVTEDGVFLRLEVGLKYWSFEGLTIQNTKGYGILIKGSHLQISKNEIIKAGWDGIKTLCGSSDLELVDNLIVRPYEDGIDVIGTDGAKILRNVIDHSNHDGIFTKGGARNIVIEGNKVIQPANFGIILGGRSSPLSTMCDTYECTNCKAINNLVEGAGAGGVFALGCDTGLIAQNTIVDANTLTNWTGSLGAGPGVDDGAGGGLVGSRNIRIANNIVRKNSDSRYTVYLRVYEGSTTGFSSDYNLYFGLSDGPRFSWNANPDGDPKYRLDQIQSAPISLETHAIMADPQFFNPSQGDYHLLFGSPAREAGMSLYPEVTMDLEGTLRPASGSGPWDLGAYEGSPRPLLTTDSISNLTLSSVTLNGTINPNGIVTTYGFQWGLTTAYGNAIDGRSVLSGISNVAVSSDLQGLIPNATYHYRLTATSSAGTTYGPDMTFTTAVASLIAPWGLLSITSPSFLWYAVPNATRYCLYIDDITGNKVNQWYTAADAGCASGTGICSVTPSVVLALGSGAWQVQTQNNVGTGPRSSPLNFTIVANAPKNDFNADGQTDILWRNKDNGNVAIWTMNGATLTNGVVIANAPLVWDIAGTGDFNGDGQTDILWRNKDNGNVAIWTMNGATLVNGVVIANAPLVWDIAGTGDFNGDGQTDILWRNKGNGNVAVWYMNGATLVNGVVIANAPLVWDIAGTGDFNGDGQTDILWRNKGNGNVAVWYMNGATLVNGVVIANAPIVWDIAGTGDFNGDGQTDILWRNKGNGNVAVWYMNRATLTNGVVIANVPLEWELKGR